MSAQFGKWNFGGRPVDPRELDDVRPVLAPYGPDGEGLIAKNGMAILYRAFHTTKESRREIQPHVSASGGVLTWDGRLDNRTELIRDVGESLDHAATDVQIVSSAYDKWGPGCFPRLVGDWALAVWEPRKQALILAKDFLGSHHLYYSRDDNQVTWSTILDPLILFAKTFELSEEYIAGWLSFFPAPHLTPYIGICSVPPSSFVLVTPANTTVEKYWDFDPRKRIRYRTDEEYEEQFRAVFAQSVARRLRSDSPVLAELSGGMDSSSIVCVADTVIANGAAETPALDTLSYYDDSEPNWNERPYFTKVEEKRQRSGCHIDAASRGPLMDRLTSDRLAASPGSFGQVTKATQQQAEYMISHGNRVLLSGIGGDEVTGGVPSPIPELEDLLSQLRLGELTTRLGTWSLYQRRPWVALLLEAIRGFCPLALVGVPNHMRPPRWLASAFVRRNAAALAGYPRRLKLPGPLPNLQESIFALASVQRLLSCCPLQSAPCYEKRYPYLDRDFLEFAFRIPREQWVRPGQRRSLLRRALAGLVPNEVLNRPRKASVARSTALALSDGWPRLSELTDEMRTSALEIINRREFIGACENVHRDAAVSPAQLVRALLIEAWIRHLEQWRIIAPPRSSDPRVRSSETKRNPTRSLSSESWARARAGFTRSRHSITERR